MMCVAVRFFWVSEKGRSEREREDEGQAGSVAPLAGDVNDDDILSANRHCSRMVSSFVIQYR